MKTISFKVDDDLYEKWRRMDKGMRKLVKELVIQMIKNNGAIPITVNRNKYIVVSSKKLRRIENRIRGILRKTQDPYLQQPPLWVILELEKILEEIA